MALRPLLDSSLKRPPTTCLISTEVAVCDLLVFICLPFQTNLDAIRAVYNAFLPLYPYCYAYWKKYAELEQRSGYAER